MFWPLALVCLIGLAMACENMSVRIRTRGIEPADSCPFHSTQTAATFHDVLLAAQTLNLHSCRHVWRVDAGNCTMFSATLAETKLLANKMQDLAQLNTQIHIDVKVL